MMFYSQKFGRCVSVITQNAYQRGGQLVRKYSTHLHYTMALPEVEYAYLLLISFPYFSRISGMGRLPDCSPTRTPSMGSLRVSDVINGSLCGEENPVTSIRDWRDVGGSHIS